MIHQIRAQRREALRRLHRVNKEVRHTVFISIAARLVTYAAVCVEWIFPKWANKTVDPFLCPGFSCPMKAKWYIYYASQNVAWFLMCYVFCKVCLNYSNHLFLVSVIMLSYHILDAVLFVWNFNRYGIMQVDLMWTALALIWSVFKGYKPETIAKIKSLF